MKNIALSIIMQISIPCIVVAMDAEDRTLLARHCIKSLTRSGMAQERAYTHIQEIIEAEKAIQDACHIQKTTAMQDAYMQTIIQAQRKLKGLASERKLSDNNQKDFNQIIQYLLDTTNFNDALKLFAASASKK